MTEQPEQPRLFDLIYRLHDEGAIDDDEAGELCMAIARSNRAEATPAVPEQDEAVRLDWTEWNRLPHPDGMTIMDPDGFRNGKPTVVTWDEFLVARGYCTLMSRREAPASPPPVPAALDAMLLAAAIQASGLPQHYVHKIMDEYARLSHQSEDA